MPAKVDFSGQRPERQSLNVPIEVRRAMPIRVLILLCLSLPSSWGQADDDKTAQNLPHETTKFIPGLYISENHVFRDPLKVERSSVTHTPIVISPKKRFLGNKPWNWHGGPENIELKYRWELPPRWKADTVFKMYDENFERSYAIELKWQDDELLIREKYQGPGETKESWKEHEKPYRLAPQEYYRYYEHLLSNPDLTAPQRTIDTLFLKVTSGELLEPLIDVNVRDPLDQTLLMAGLIGGREEITATILKQKPDLTLTNHFNQTAYGYLVSNLNFHGKTSESNALAMISYSPPRGEDFERVLDWAIQHQFYQAVETLIGEDEPIVAKSEVLVKLVTHAPQPMPERLEKLLSSLMESGVNDPLATKLLGILFLNQHNAFAEGLLEKGFNPNGRDAKKRTVLMLAVIHKNNSMAETLRSRWHVDETYFDDDGYNAAAHAARVLNGPMYQKLANLSNLSVGYGPNVETLEILLGKHLVDRVDEATHLIAWSESGTKRFINYYDQKGQTVLDKLILEMSRSTDGFRRRDSSSEPWRKHYGDLCRAYQRLTSLGAIAKGERPPLEYLNDPEVFVGESRPRVITQSGYYEGLGYLNLGPTLPRYTAMPTGIITNGAGMQFQLNANGTASPLGHINDVRSSPRPTYDSFASGSSSRTMTKGVTPPTTAGNDSDSLKTGAIYKNGRPTDSYIQPNGDILNTKTGRSSGDYVDPTGTIMDSATGRSSGNYIDQTGAIINAASGRPTGRRVGQ